MLFCIGRTMVETRIAVLASVCLAVAFTWSCATAPSGESSRQVEESDRASEAAATVEANERIVKSKLASFVESLRQDSSGASTSGQTRGAAIADGWQIDCFTEEEYATYRCFARGYGTTQSGKGDIPFRVTYYQLVPVGTFWGPRIEPGWHTSSRSAPSVGVDSFPPVSDMSSSKLLGQLERGSVGFAEYHAWPAGKESMSIPLDGFPEAYERLRTRVSEFNDFVVELWGEDGKSEIERSARYLAREYGEAAVGEANRRAEAMLPRGDIAGYQRSKAVAREIEALLMAAREPQPLTD